MKPIPPIIDHTQLDLHGCEYDESQQLTHIDGFLVYYNGHGRLTLSADLTDQEKLRGMRRLLDQLEQTVEREAQLYFWTRDDLASTLASGQAPRLVALPPNPSEYPPPDVPAVDVAAASALSVVVPGAARTQLLSLLHIPRVIVHTAARTIVSQPGVRRGPDQEAHMLVENDTPSGHYTSLSLRRLTSAHCSLLVQIDPPASGHIRVILGAHSFQAMLTATGTALLDRVPLELLLDADGPDLEVLFEQIVADRPD